MDSKSHHNFNREKTDLVWAFFSSLVFHVVLFLVLASTSIFYPAVGSAMRFDFIWLDASLTQSAPLSLSPVENNVVAPSLAGDTESLNNAVEGAVQQKSEIVTPQPTTLPIAPEEPPETESIEDEDEPELELTSFREEVKQPDSTPVKPLPTPKQTIDLKAEHERRVAEEAQLRAAQAEAERLRLSVELARKEHLARERAEQQRREIEQAAVLKAEQEQRAAEDARIKAAQEEAERLFQVAEKTRLDRMALERAELQRKADERAATLRMEQERQAAEVARLKAAQEEVERLRQAAERARQDRLAREQAEQKHRAAEQAAKLKAAEEQRAAEDAKLKAAQEEADRQRQVAERARQDRLAREQAEQKRRAAEQAAKVKAAQEQRAAEEARLKAAQEEAERQRQAAERAQQDRLAREQAEQKRRAAEQAAKVKAAQELKAVEEARQKAAKEEEVAERARRERMAREQAEQQRKTAELADRTKAEQEKKAADEARQSAEKERLAKINAQLEKAAAMHKVEVAKPQPSPGGPASSLRKESPVIRSTIAQSEQTPVTPKPEKKGIVIPTVHGDLKLVVNSKSSLKIVATFRAYPKSRRNRPQTLSESRQEKNITPLMVTQGDETREAIIERTQEGIYTFIAEPGDAETPRSGFTLKIFESTSKARTRPIGDKTVSGKTIVTRVLMPDGILWEDESAFTGSIEDSNSITKFNAETGLIWKEFNN